MRRALLVVVLAGAPGAAACGSGGGELLPAGPSADSLPGDAGFAPSAPMGPCNAVVQQHPIEGRTHVPVCSVVDYLTNPPSSGNHYPIWAAYKTYTEPVPLGFVVHDLEHGAIVLTYNCAIGDGGGDECDTEVRAAQQMIDGLPADPECVELGEGVARRTVMTPIPISTSASRRARGAGRSRPIVSTRMHSRPSPWPTTRAAPRTSAKRARIRSPRGSPRDAEPSSASLGFGSASVIFPHGRLRQEGFVMRMWRYVLGASLLGGGAFAVACSSSSSTATPGEDAGGTDGGGGGDAVADAPATPACDAAAVNVATFDSGSSSWSCIQAACYSMGFSACGMDCTCNNALLSALACVNAKGAAITSAEEMACFSTPIMANLSDTAVSGIVSCLEAQSPKCGGPAIDGGEAGTTDGGGSEGGEGGGSTSDGGDGAAE